ncbi:SUPT6H (predicted) [Pycnogonum litorale]
MSQFVDSEAEESDDEEVINRKRKFVESDEDEEDDEEKLREEMKDLINDDEVEEANDSDDSVRSRKKRRRREDEDDRLEDDDYDLLEENLGVKVQRKKFKRLRRVKDDDDSDEGDGKREEQVDRDAIAGELFEGSDEEGGRKSPQGDDERSRQEFGDLSESEMESDPDDFIVDDDGQPIHKAKKRQHVKYNDA